MRTLQPNWFEISIHQDIFHGALCAVPVANRENNCSLLIQIQTWEYVGRDRISAGFVFHWNNFIAQFLWQTLDRIVPRWSFRCSRISSIMFVFFFISFYFIFNLDCVRDSAAGVRCSIESRLLENWNPIPGSSKGAANRSDCWQKEANNSHPLRSSSISLIFIWLCKNVDGMASCTCGKSEYYSK